MNASMADKLLDPLFFVRRMGIIDVDGRQTTLHNLKPEQVAVVEAIRDHNRIAILKPRQIGITTAVIAALVHRALFSADKYDVYTITHEQKACGRVNQMARNFWRTLPDMLRPELVKDNSQELAFGHNGSSFTQSMAGGRSQGRSFTYQCLHATEMGLWPKGSSAREGSAVDADVWASAMSTIHENEKSRIIVESTADGPSGIFYKTVKTARESKGWKFLFFPWKDFAEYSTTPHKDFQMTDDELELALLHDLTIGQVAWRRMKIVDQSYGLQRFRREYPLTWQEPFMKEGNSWFNLENLNLMAAGIPATRQGDDRSTIIYEKYKPTRKYFMGGDSSGGVGKDYAVWQVLRDDLKQVAVFHDNNTGPGAFAEVGAKLSAMYGRCKIACEDNNHGRRTNLRLRELGANVWTDSKGKFYWSTKPKKVVLYDYGRSCIDGGYVDLNDPNTLDELTHIREQRNGNIEADEGYHDDLADAYMLALWLARRQYGPSKEIPMNERIQRQRKKVHRILRLRT